MDEGSGGSDSGGTGGRIRKIIFKTFNFTQKLQAMKKCVLFCASLLTFFSGFKIYAQDEGIFIKDVGKISMPSSLEIQDGSYKELNKNIYQNLGLEYTSDNLIFQQKGLNKAEKESFKTYVRVMIKTYRATPGTFGSYKSKQNLTPSELKEFDNIFQKQTNQELLSNTKLVKWLGTKETMVNGMHCLVSSYQRQMGEQPIVQIDKYIFQNDDKMYTLTFSYRINQLDVWKPVLNRMRDSFNIIK